MRNTNRKFALFLILIIIISNLSLLTVKPTFAQTSPPSVGVKPGDWMEYNVVIHGTPPPIHDVNWLRIEILQVEGDTFQANFTVRYLNGTLYSTIWKFNFTSGDTEGWIIIPSNLSPGNTFRDLFNSTTSKVTIQRQEQKTVAGATRTIIFANDSLRTKEWDKATGVFTNSSETFKNWSSHVYMTATNMWCTQIMGIDQTTFFTTVTLIVVTAAVVLALTIAVAVKKNKLSNS